MELSFEMLEFMSPRFHVKATCRILGGSGGIFTNTFTLLELK